MPPAQKVWAHPENRQHCASHVLAPTLRALDAALHFQNVRHRATRLLDTWKEDYESIPHSISASERKRSSPPSVYQSKVYKDIDCSSKPMACRPGLDHSAETQSPNPSDNEIDEGGIPFAMKPKLLGFFATRDNVDSLVLRTCTNPYDPSIME